jgi:chitodextrinase
MHISSPESARRWRRWATISLLSLSAFGSSALGQNTIFGSLTPGTPDGGPDSSVNLGVRFQSSVAGTISGIRFYKSSSNTGTHIGTLYTDSGTQLAQATFTNETSSGWQQVTFTPVSISANTTYVAAYLSPVGHYAADNNYFASAHVNSPLTALADNPSGDRNSVYTYGSSPAFPTSTYQACNYWVDVLFNPSGGGGTNVAPNGTAYDWHSNTTATSNANRVAMPGLNDGNTTTDNDLAGAQGWQDNTQNAYEAGGVIWSTAQRISSVAFINGSWNGSDGSYCANMTMQTTTDGSTWTQSGWSFSPSYTYNGSDAGTTFTFSGSAVSVLGVRVSGEVHCGTNRPYFENMTEVMAYTSGGGSVPGAPSNLSATPASCSQINLSWTASAGTVTGYYVYRNSSKIATVTTTSYSNTGLTASTQYSYYVVAYNGNGNSPNSNTAQATTPACGSVPGAPSNLTATAATCSEINLSWTASTGTVTGYYVYRNSSQIATTSSTSYSDTGVAASTQYSYYVVGYNGNGNSGNSNTAQATTPSCGGITLQNIDGGPTYYATNGFTYATSTTFNGMSWDDPRFFPIGQDYCFYSSNAPATFKALGLNFSHRVTGDTDLAVLRNNGIWALPSPGEGTDNGAETFGWHIEEPSSWSGITSQVQGLGSALSGRLLQISMTWDQFVYGALSGTPGNGSIETDYSDLISTSIGNVHLNIPSADIYWFAGSTDSNIQYSGGMVYGLGANATADQMARGSNYGDMVDQMRAWVATYPAPNGGPYIETEDGLLNHSDPGGVREITPPEFNWAAWSSIVHGARWLLYFSTTSNYGSGSTFGFSTSILSGQSISMYNQAIATNTLVKNVAPIINAPFALNYASVTPAGYTFPTPHLVFDNGIDIMAKYYTGGNFNNSAGNFSNGYYIFSTVRGSETQTNIHATFTIANTGATTATVVNENRTLPITNGTTFTDTFANASTVHIYQVH